MGGQHGTQRRARPDSMAKPSHDGRVMTTLTGLPSTSSAARPPTPSDPRHRRPLVLVASLGGLTAAGTTLVVLCALGVIGWFVTDAGMHGAPRDGLRVAGLAWLAAHGSGVHVQGSAITLLPLGITAVCAWVTWRLGYRVGDSVSGHGPDAEDISNGERDWTVPTAVALFTAAYVVLVAVTGVLAASEATAPSIPAAITGAALLAIVFGGAGIAVGSGRAAIWAARVPLLLRVSLAGGRRITIAYLVASLVVVSASLILNFSTAATIASRLQADAGDTALFVLASVFVLPNAVIFGGAYLLGPGFALGAKTVVSPALVVLGPLPLFPLLAAVPAPGSGSALTKSLVAVPIVVAAWAVAQNHRRYPTVVWLDGIVRGGVAGVFAGIAFAVLASLAGGAIGPGRMRHVSPFVFDVLVHAIAYFGIGGLLAGVAMTWWTRRSLASTLPHGGSADR